MNLFGVTAQGVLDRHIPRAPPLGASTKPTLTAASALVNQIAGEVCGAIRFAGVDPDAITLVDYEEQYYAVQLIIDLGVLCKLGKSGLHQSVQEGVANACEEYTKKLDLLREDPSFILGDDLIPSSDSDFSSPAIDDDILFDPEASSTEPKARVDDPL